MTYDMVLRYLVPFIVVGSNVTWWFQLSICFLEVENENQNQNKVHVEPTRQWHERNWIWVQLRLLKERRRWTCLWFTKCSSSGCPKLGNLDYRKSIFENDQALCRIQGNYAGPPHISGETSATTIGCATFPLNQSVSHRRGWKTSGCCRLQFPGVHFVWLFRPPPASRQRFRLSIRWGIYKKDMSYLGWFPRGFWFIVDPICFWVFPMKRAAKNCMFGGNLNLRQIIWLGYICI